MDEKVYTYDGIKRSERELNDEEKSAIEDIREGLMEKVAETDEELLEKYFEGEAFTKEEITTGLRRAVASGDLVPLTDRKSVV